MNPPPSQTPNERRQGLLQMALLGGSLAFAGVAIWMRRQMEFSAETLQRDHNEIGRPAMDEEIIQNFDLLSEFELLMEAQAWPVIQSLDPALVPETGGGRDETP